MERIRARLSPSALAVLELAVRVPEKVLSPVWREAVEELERRELVAAGTLAVTPLGRRVARA